MRSEELIRKIKDGKIPVGTKIHSEEYTGNLLIDNFGHLRLEKEYWETLEGNRHPLNLYCVVDMLTNPNAEFEIVEECNQVSKLKLIDVLNMIAKGELKEGTKFVYRGNMYIWEDNAILNTTNLDAFDIADRSDLNMELELIEPPCEHEWLDWETHRMGEGRIRRYRRCNKCGLEEEAELYNHFADVGKMVEELDINALTWKDLLEYQKIEILFDKLNEVIRKINKEE